MYANYHTHTFRCGHASGTEEEYLNRAIENGIRIMGFSDHAPFAFPDGYESSWRIKVKDAEEYISTLREIREKYKEKVTIHIGFEMEYYPKYFDKMLKYVKELGAEYLILGQHFLGSEYPDGVHSMFCANDAERLHEFVDCVTAAIKTGEFKYVAHPDIFVYNKDDEIYRREITRLCTVAKECDVPLEINFLGIFENRNYPYEPFWKIVSEVGCKVIFGFDAHDVARAYDAESLEKAKKLVKKYSLNLVDELNFD